MTTDNDRTDNDRTDRTDRALERIAVRLDHLSEDVLWLRLKATPDPDAETLDPVKVAALRAGVEIMDTERFMQSVRIVEDYLRSDNDDDPPGSLVAIRAARDAACDEVERLTAALEDMTTKRDVARAASDQWRGHRVATVDAIEAAIDDLDIDDLTNYDVERIARIACAGFVLPEAKS